MTFPMLKLTVLVGLVASVAGTGLDCISGYQGTDQVSSMRFWGLVVIYRLFTAF